MWVINAQDYDRRHHADGYYQRFLSNGRFYRSSETATKRFVAVQQMNFDVVSICYWDDRWDDRKEVIQ